MGDIIVELFAAVRGGDGSTMEELLNSKKFNVNSTDDKGKVALQVAIEAGQVESVKILVDHGADVNFPVQLSRRNFSLLKFAITRGNCEIVELLLNSGAKMRPDEATPLHQACIYDDKSMAKMLLDRRDQHGDLDKDGLLYLTVKNGSSAGLVKILLQKFNNIQSSNNFDGMSPLFAARSEKDAQLLIDYGADVHAKFKFQFGLEGIHTESITLPFVTTLRHACTSGLGQVAKVLLEHGIDVNDRSSNCEDNNMLFQR